MMIEYTHLPAVIWDNVLPYHFGININTEEKESLLKATSIYSKVRIVFAISLVNMYHPTSISV